MKTTMCVGLVLAGIAGTAAAQGQDVNASDFVLSIDYADDIISVGQTTTATITASWIGAPTSYLSSINIDLNANGNFVTVDSTPDLSSWAVPILGWTGTESFADGSSIRGIEGAQFALFFPPQIVNPFVVGTFTVTGSSIGVLSYTADFAALAPISFTVSDTAVLTANPAQFLPSSLAANQLTVIPSAPGFGLLAAAGLVATRRRRA